MANTEQTGSQELRSELSKDQKLEEVISSSIRKGVLDMFLLDCLKSYSVTLLEA